MFDRRFWKRTKAVLKLALLVLELAWFAKELWK
jgi:hypothetical protein